MSAPLLHVENLTRWHRLPAARLLGEKPVLKAVNGVSFSVRAGEAFGIVGESGCGKSTLARLVMGLEPPTGGSVRIDGLEFQTLSAREQRQTRQKLQMVFQDPFGSLNPRWPVWRIIAEPLHLLDRRPSRAEVRQKVADLLTAVGMDPAVADRYPHEFSGGQRQRLAIARALITAPRLLVADEPVSALDLSVQAQVLNLLMDLQAEFGLALLLISHNLSVVAHVTRRLAVMYRGRFVETGPTAALFATPRHPYTQALLAAEPSLDPSAGLPAAPPGEAGDGDGPGCAYAGRCPLADSLCRSQEPVLRHTGAGTDPEQAVACHHAGMIG